MIKTIKIQQNEIATTINIPKKFVEFLGLQKGQVVLLKIEDSRIIIETEV